MTCGGRHDAGETPARENGRRGLAVGVLSALPVARVSTLQTDGYAGLGEGAGGGRVVWVRLGRGASRGGLG
jgi:hypothetical protein